MSEEKKMVPRRGAASLKEVLSLFDAPEKASWNPEEDEPRHPFIDRLISVETKLDEFIRWIRERDMSGSKTVILDNADFIALFKISGKTAQNWRDEGLIEYSQVKGKIYYRAKDVEKLLNRSRR